MVLSFYQKYEKEYQSMTEKEMMKQMQDLLGIRKKPSEKEAAAIALADSVDELAEMFCDSAIVLSRISSLLQEKKNPWNTKNFEDMDDWDEDDMACMDATVLFAVPGKPVQLMTEEDALSKFPGFDDEQTFYCVEIGDHLFLHYMEHTWESEEDMVSVREIFLNDDHDVAYSNSILEKYVQNIAEIEKGLVELRLKADVADKAEKKKLNAQIKSAEDSVEAMRIARKSMAKFVSSYEIGLSQQ